MSKATGRAKLFEKYDEHIEKDHDPETEHIVASGSDEGSDNENAGTEHYVDVSKSNLRQKGENSLGPQYRGSKVSRIALEQESSGEDSNDQDEYEEADEEEYDDPETANLDVDTLEAGDSEIGSDDALGESDNEKLSGFVFRGSSKPKQPKSKRAAAADYMSDSSAKDEQDEGDDNELDDDEDDDEEEDDMSDGLEALIDGEAEESGEEDEDGDEDEDEDEDGDEDEDEDEEEDVDEGEKSSKAKPAMNGRTPSADIEKGAAIQKQRKLYDGLLNLRIRLQKALIAANTFSALEEEHDADDAITKSYATAEATAISLLSSISHLRENCGAPAAAGTKRKRDYEVSATSAEIWEQLQEEDRRAVKIREKCLEKWSRKVQSVNVAAPKGLSSRNTTLVGSLHDQLNNPENRLAKRTRVPRSCAPAQHAKKINEDETIFDDADFYQLLLKELVEQRTVDSSHQTSAVPSVVLTASRENKTRKVVDRKASKGRKMRFTVHEKVQNFMASEDRRQWEQAAIDRFFSTLFGRKLELNEDEADEDEDMDDVADAGFKLFA
ncbi:protein BFR2 [Cordyceps militaris]|uniref:Protein BFR2 n=1 Tax=Cordyceps militaris TaxID=73501 RepID=A0A2H4SM04_CORMI|nr:protein BFR2 [Cordyceps militaris]